MKKSLALLALILTLCLCTFVACKSNDKDADATDTDGNAVQSEQGTDDESAETTGDGYVPARPSQRPGAGNNGTGNGGGTSGGNTPQDTDPPVNRNTDNELPPDWLDLSGNAEA